MAIPALQKTIKAVVYESEGYYVTECTGISVVTQGSTIEETLRNLQEAVALYLEDEDPAEFGLVPNPSIVVTMEMEPAHTVELPTL
ncbi:MAG: type II toxin-antitoxin system HicB family antitoxin [Armatimonadetes bacterium]|nr:type II toxin-antitoxin system HicB family antitoxin [Armatimonadota bacterium]